MWISEIFDKLRFWGRNAEIFSLGVRNTKEYRLAMKEYIKEHPNCEFCGRNKKVDVHHKKPVSFAPELAADKNNMITLCRKPQCHLVVGHLGNYKNYNKHIDLICGLMKNDIDKTN